MKKIINGSSESTEKSSLEVLLWSGFVAGTLDALAGIIVYWIILGRMNIIQILQWIASGIIGEDAFKGGILTALLGNVFHYVIAYLFAIFYFLIAPSFPVLLQNKYKVGLLYGLLIWVIMNLIVLPLSNVAAAPLEINVALMGITWHMALVGLPIVIIINKYYKN